MHATFASCGPDGRGENGRPPRATRRPEARCWTALAVAAVAFAASANTLGNGFFLDDFQAILANPWIREPGRLGEAFGTHLVGFDPRFTTSYYRPLVHVVYAAAHALSGPRPWAYHLASVLLHALASAVLFVLLARWGEVARGPPERDETPARPAHALSGPFLASALFAVHPVHCEAVAWAGAVMDVACALFFLLALLAGTATRASFAASAAAMGGFFLAALLFKEPAVMFPPTLLVALAARGDLREASRRSRVLALSAVLLAVLGLYLAARVRALGGLTGGDRRVALDARSTALTAFGLLSSYLEKLVWPVGLRPFHDFEPIRTASSPRFVAGVCAAAILALVAWRFRRRAGVLAGTALLLLPLLPALHAPSLGEGLLSERYLYLPSAGAAVLLGVALEELLSRPRGAASRYVAVGAIAACALATVRQNAVWRDDLTLWTEGVRQSPRSAPMLERLGNARLAAGDLAGAADSLSRAVRIEPERLDARTNLAVALGRLGRASEARHHYDAVLLRRPDDVDALVGRGWTLAAEDRLHEALASYAAALGIDPRRADAHNLAAIAHARAGQLGAAAEHFRTAIRLDPGNPEYVRNLALISR